MLHRGPLQCQLGHGGPLTGAVVLAVFILHVGLYTALCQSITPLPRVIPHSSGAKGAKKQCPLSGALVGNVGSGPYHAI